MRYVRHDPSAARSAAATCRARAADYERIAGEIGEAVSTVAWWGDERDRIVDDVVACCDELRREASSLRRSADLLEAAARAAEQREVDLADAARRAELAAAAAAEARALELFTAPSPSWPTPNATVPITPPRAPVPTMPQPPSVPAAVQ